MTYRSAQWAIKVSNCILIVFVPHGLRDFWITLYPVLIWNSWFKSYYGEIHRRTDRKLNSLLRHDTAQNYRILLRVVQRLFQNILKISHRRHI
jgi:hypothetical protein